MKSNLSSGIEFQRDLWLDCRRSLENPGSRLTPESSRLLQQVVGKGGDIVGYLYGGFTTSIGIRAILKSAGYDHTSLQVLDFGCGAGRVARWFRDFAVDGKLYGVDIDGEAIDWCSRNLGGHYHRGGALPPLNFDESSMDLIYGISVLTHFDEEYQGNGFEELHRICKPGGLVLLSVHGEDKALHSLPPFESKVFKDSGFVYMKASDPGLDGLPDFYQLGFNSMQHVEAVWSEYFDLLQYVKHGPFYEQDLVVMTKRGSEQSLPLMQDIDLPICCFETPPASTVVEEGNLVVSGWAFSPQRDPSTSELEVWLDGTNVGSCHTGVDRPVTLPRFDVHQFPKQS